MVKITSKLYRPADLLDVINVMEKVVTKINNEMKPDDCKDIVVDLRKAGYKIVKVDDGISEI